MAVHSYFRTVDNIEVPEVEIPEVIVPDGCRGMTVRTKTRGCVIKRHVVRMYIQPPPPEASLDESQCWTLDKWMDNRLED